MSDTVRAHDLSFELFLSENLIQERVREMGAAIAAKHQRHTPLFLGVLNGAFVFAADLIRACGIDCNISFIKLSSYQGTRSTGALSTLIGLEEDVQGRDIILVEDIIDTGHTLHSFIPDLRRLEPRSIEVATLLLKPDALVYPVHIDYLGFEIPDKFVIGYGLDYDGLGRNLPGIYQLVQ